MVLVLEKPPLSMRPAPPPYIVNEAANPPPFPNAHKVPTTLASLSPALLLKIVYSTFPQLPDRDRGKMERQRMTLYWLNTSLRLVNRSLYIGEYYTQLHSSSSHLHSMYACTAFHIPTSVQLPDPTATLVGSIPPCNDRLDIVCDNAPIQGNKSSRPLHLAQSQRRRLHGRL